MQFTSVTLNLITTETERFDRFVIEDRLSKKVPSDAVSVFHPILLIESLNDLHLLAGWHGYVQAKPEPDSILAAYIIDDNLSAKEILDTVVRYHAALTGFSFLEKARALSALHKHGRFSFEHIAIDYAQILGLPPKTDHLETLCQVAEWPEERKSMVRSGRISSGQALTLAGYDAAFQQELCKRLLEVAAFSDREFELVCEYLNELPNILGKSLKEILDQNVIQAILDDRDLPNRKKGTAIFNLFREYRYPALTAAENHFKAHLKKMKLYPNIMIRYPNNFEGDRLEISLKPADADETVTMARSLAEQGEHLHKLYEILKHGESK